MESELAIIKPDKIQKNKIEVAKNLKCTYDRYGAGVTVSIDVFYCTICSKSVCEECLLNCHNQDCLKSKNPPYPDFFADNTCECGREGHADRKKANTAIKAECNLYEIYINYPKNNYHCETCRKNYCFICFHECHGRMCNSDKFILVEDASFKCSCIYYNHDNNNFLFRLLQQEEITKVTFMSRIYSNAFYKQVMTRYINIIQTTIADGVNTKLIKGDYNLYEFDFANLMNSYRIDVKHFFYFPENLTNLFPYQFLTEAFGKWDENKNVEDYKAHLGVSFKYRYNFIISVIHLKNDFKQFKKLSTHYYLNASLSERLKLRFLLQQQIKTKPYDKYNFFGQNKEEMSFLAFIDQNVSLLKYDYYPYRTLDVLIARVLKSHILDIEGIIKLIKAFVKLPKIRWSKIRFDNLTRLALAYNDALIFESMQKKEVSHHGFLHKKNDYSETFLKCFLAHIEITVDDHFKETQDNFNRKKFAKNMTKAMEVLKLFSTAENSFAEDLNNFENQGYQDYCNFIKLYQNLNNPKNAHRFENKFTDLLKLLINDIDTECRNYYYYESTYYDKMIIIISNFASSYGKLLPEFNREEGEGKLDAQKIRHFERIVDTLKMFFPQFVTNENFYCHLTSPNFVETLKIVYFIRSIFTILESLKIEENTKDKEKVLDLMYGFLSLLTTTKEGLDYLITNNVFKKIDALFDTYKSQSCWFFYMLRYGV
jgi:hypothetical protein